MAVFNISVASYILSVSAYEHIYIVYREHRLYHYCATHAREKELRRKQTNNRSKRRSG